MCCCSREHLCPDAWQLIYLAHQARARRSITILDAARQEFTTHLRTAGVIRFDATAWPDHSPLTMQEDPRCPACPPVPTP